MLERIKGGIILFPLLFVLLAGGKLLYFAAFILSILGLKELYSAFEIKGFKAIRSVSLAFCITVLIQNMISIPTYLLIFIYFALFVYATILTILKKHTIIDFCITFFGIMYIVIPFESIVRIYEINNQPFNLVWLIFLIAFANDISAYAIGKNFGKKKLIPDVSPNKTVEGSIGAIIGTIIIISTVAIITNLNLPLMLVIAISGSILAQIGDLFASSIKRYSGVKDFSNLIPGHGGIIDRFDSILFVTPLILILTHFLCS